jgi:hypothetical protein
LFRAAGVVLCLVCAAACGTPRVVLPTGGGTPFPESTSAYNEATAECRAIKTMSASLALSGRAGSTKLSARIDAGFAGPDRLRLEGFPRVAFGGKPFFVLVARDGHATLVLTRDASVLRGAPPAAIVEALAGIALDPAELRAVVSGCGLGPAPPGEGRAFPNGWAAVESGDTTVFLRQIDGRWRVAAARRAPLSVAAAQGAVTADIRLRLSQVEIDVPLVEAAFEADVPAAAAPITLEELRKAGPLG